MYRINKILIPAFASFFVFNPLFAKSQKIDLSLKNEPLGKMIKQIESITEYTFMLDQSIDQTQKVSLHVQQADLRDVLVLAFASKQIN